MKRRDLLKGLMVLPFMSFVRKICAKNNIASIDYDQLNYLGKDWQTIMLKEEEMSSPKIYRGDGIESMFASFVENDEVIEITVGREYPSAGYGQRTPSGYDLMKVADAKCIEQKWDRPIKVHFRYHEKNMDSFYVFYRDPSRSNGVGVANFG